MSHPAQRWQTETVGVRAGKGQEGERVGRERKVKCDQIMQRSE